MCHAEKAVFIGRKHGLLALQAHLYLTKSQQIIEWVDNPQKKLRSLVMSPLMRRSMAEECRP